MFLEYVSYILKYDIGHVIISLLFVVWNKQCFETANIRQKLADAYLSMRQCYGVIQIVDSAKSEIYDEDEWAEMQKVTASTRFSLRRNQTDITKMCCLQNGYIIVFICPDCRILVRGGDVYCPRCHKVKFIKSCGSQTCQANGEYGKNKSGETPKSPSCFHITQVINRDYRHVIIHPTWVMATDVFLHLEEELVDITRQDIVGSIRSDAAEDTCSSVSSLNMVSMATRLGENEIRDEAMHANPVETATPVRDFLAPKFMNSLEAKLKGKCNVVIVIELTASSI